MCVCTRACCLHLGGTNSDAGAYVCVFWGGGRGGNTWAPPNSPAAGVRHQPTAFEGCRAQLTPEASKQVSCPTSPTQPQPPRNLPEASLTHQTILLRPPPPHTNTPLGVVRILYPNVPVLSLICQSRLLPAMLCPCVNTHKKTPSPPVLLLLSGVVDPGWHGAGCGPLAA